MSERALLVHSVRVAYTLAYMLKMQIYVCGPAVTFESINYSIHVLKVFFRLEIYYLAKFERAELY